MILEWQKLWSLKTAVPVLQAHWLFIKALQNEKYKDNETTHPVCQKFTQILHFTF